jgi:transglutaminase-like putative cysteine protease
MKYKISHTTVYEYTDAVPVCQNVLHLTPRTTPRQRCLYHRLNIRPTPVEITRRSDYFGNAVQDFSLHQGHRTLRVTAVSKVEVTPSELPDVNQSTGWEALGDRVKRVRSAADLEAYQYCFDSPHVTRAAELAEYAEQSFHSARPILLATMDLNRRIHADFTYDPEATDVQTPCLEVFRQRRGVCQDLAHVAISCLRSLGLPSRYVSGYLRTIPPEGRPRLAGADASHAWFSVYCGSLGWVDFDPTNNLMPVNDHITLAWGRDYSDVAPIRGMLVGGGRHRMIVSVDVVPLDGAA